MVKEKTIMRNINVGAYLLIFYAVILILFGVWIFFIKPDGNLKAEYLFILVGSYLIQPIVLFALGFSFLKTKSKSLGIFIFCAYLFMCLLILTSPPKTIWGLGAVLLTGVIFLNSMISAIKLEKRIKK
jgi:hypothetical protein